ncbi:MAG TPA: AraC family transcriptional regulator [Vicinamibacterales bacterium]|nr:AraC family transcriptional regulator [Vicinamibacterales bacterium]
MSAVPSRLALEPARQRLVARIGARTVGSEDTATAIASLGLFRREARTEPCACRVEPALVLVVQGAKQLLIGGRPYPYDVERFVITSLDLPARSQVLEASPERPCLGLVLKLDLRLLAELIAHGGLPAPRDKPAEGSAMLGGVTPPLLEACARLVALLDEDATTQAVLAPLVVREIHFRLLRSEAAVRLWQIAAIGTPGQRIARALEWIRRHYAEPMRIGQLAAHVQMSPSSLHEHFKQLTAMTPLQYQKWLRLNEARRLMVNEGLDAATTAFRVGYESASQFSREYARLFGAPPRRDIEALKRQGLALAASSPPPALRSQARPAPA